MKSNTQTRKESDDVRTARVGTDAAGYEHRYNPFKRYLVIVDGDGDVVHERDLHGATISDWIDTVRREQGEWQELKLETGGWIEGTVRDIYRTLDGDRSE